MSETNIKTAAGLVEKPADSRRILILGLGNILLKDEGIGVHIAQRLQSRGLPDNVQVIDAGTACLDVLLLAGDIEKLVIIDAMRAGKKPGTVYKTQLNAKDRLREVFVRSNSPKISLHQVGLIDALIAAERMGRAGEEIVLIAVEPAEISCGLELSRQIQKKVDKIIDLVLKEIEDDIYRK